MSKNLFVAVRASEATVKKLDDVADKYKTTRTKLIRELLEYSDYLYPLLRQEVALREEENNKLIEELSQKMMAMIVNKVTVEMMNTMEKAVHLTAEKLASENRKKNDTQDRKEAGES